MKVFISWSGDRSKNIANVLRGWLPGVLQAVRPYFSPDDIEKGARWTTEIAKELEQSRIGLLVLTKENLKASWLMFEAGALAKNLDRSRVCPILFGLEPTDVTGPLVQFQSARFEKSEVERIVKMINTELGDSALASSVLESVFEMWWPKLQSQVQAEMDRTIETQSGARSERELIEEVLTLTRGLVRLPRFGVSVHPRALIDLVEGYASLLRAAKEGPCDPAIMIGLRLLERPIKHLARHSRLPNDLAQALREEGFDPLDEAGSNDKTES